MGYKRFTPPIIFSLIAGSIGAAGFAPHNFPILILISLLAIICIWHNCKPNQGFWCAFAYGVGYFATGTSWVYISIKNFGGASILEGSLITAAFVATLSIYIALAGYLWCKLNRRQHPVAGMLLLLPSCWVLLEWLRGWLFSGFPWLMVGNGLIDTALRGWAPLVSVFGVSWLAVCFVASVFLLLHQRSSLNAKRIIGYLCLWIVIWGGGWGLNHISWTKPNTKPQTIAMIQGNIQPALKWDSAKIAKSLQDYMTITQKIAPNHDIVIWPETAITVSQLQVSNFLNQINQLGINTKTAIITGIPWEDTGLAQHFYNAVIALGWNSHGLYKKRHLVPFGEYQPQPWLFNPIFKAFSLPMSDFYPGPKKQHTLSILGQSVQAFICYEVAYPKLVIDSAPNANWLLAVSDDSWFGRSSASAQQMQMAAMSALETGKPMAYATASGITALIDSHGYVTKRIPSHVRAVLSGSITPVTGQTPISWYSVIGIMSLITLIFLAAAIYIATSKK